MHLENRLTILVNSCDAYEDLWTPFFKLLKKYGNIHGVPVLLNTESKTFSMHGFYVECVHSPGEKRYGKRMLNALSRVKTEYVLMMLDDFFLRRPMNTGHIGQILDWMDQDRKIVCFNSEQMNCYAQWESGKYPGYVRIPPASSYACNMQAAIWRTRDLMKYWSPDVSPWEWEEYCSLLTARYHEDKLYCASEGANRWIDYGHDHTGDLWAVVRGKWILEDVEPFFASEQIPVDFSVRGAYSSEANSEVKKTDGRKGQYLNRIARCLGIWGVLSYLCYQIKGRLTGQTERDDYLVYVQKKAQRKFINDMGEA